MLHLLIELFNLILDLEAKDSSVYEINAKTELEANLAENKKIFEIKDITKFLYNKII